MSEPISNPDVPENIGRNEPCPCGSGQKYKKCCQRAHRLQKESEKKSNQPHRLIGPATIPLKVYKVLTQVHSNNALGLFHELAHDEGLLRERYADKASFIEAIDKGEATLPAGADFELIHFRLDPPDTYLLLRHDDPKKSDVDFQVIVLRKNELDKDGQERQVDHKGFRIWDVITKSLPRADFDDVPAMDAFDIHWRPA